MKRSFKTRILMPTIFLLLGALPVAAIERPFALSGTGVGVFVTDAEGHVIGANVTGSGTATHLGSWTTTGTVHYAPPDENGKLPSSGEATIVAANGDKLNVVIHGSFDPASGTDHGIFQFTGGTGRFAAASGISDFVVSVNALTGGFDLTVVGSIDY